MLSNHYYINYSFRTCQDLKKSEAQTLPVGRTFPKNKTTLFYVNRIDGRAVRYISCHWTIQDTKAIIIHTGNKALAEADTCCRLFTGSLRSRASWAVEGWLTPSHTHTTPVYVPSLLSILPTTLRSLYAPTCCGTSARLHDVSRTQDSKCCSDLVCSHNTVCWCVVDNKI